MQAAQPDLKVDDQSSPAIGRIQGRSQALEKPYFRLTVAPDLSTVRPPPVLKLALKHVQQHWVQVGFSYCMPDAVPVNTRCVFLYKAPFQPSALKMLCVWRRGEIKVRLPSAGCTKLLCEYRSSAVCLMGYDGYTHCRLTCSVCGSMQTTSMPASS